MSLATNSITGISSSEKSCKIQSEALSGGQSRAFDAALQHLCAKKHKNSRRFILGVDEQPTLISL